MVILRGHFMTSAWKLGVGGHTIMGMIGHGCIQKSIDKAGYFPQNHDPWMAIPATQVRIADIAALMQALGPNSEYFFLRTERSLWIWRFIEPSKIHQRNAMQFSTPDLWLVVLFSQKISEDGTSSATRLLPEGRWGKKWQVQLVILITFISLPVIGISTYMNGWFFDDFV